MAVVHNFLTSVHKVQRRIRLLNMQKKAILIALSKMWTKIEVKFISKMLKKRAAKKNGSTVAESKLNFDFFDAKTKIEMKNQSRRWSEINSQMEGYLEQLKHRRIIKKESEEETIAKLLLPDSIRITKLTKYIQTVVSKNNEF